MDFARKQLEKYGWSEGKGLGKAEDGIVQALKPKPKHGSAGVGHDIADEFTNHWWQKLYNKAAGNIEVKKKKNGEVDSILTKTSDVLEISTQTFVKAKKKKRTLEPKLYSEKFIKRATLTNGITKETEVVDDVSSDEEQIVFKEQKLTDEELFAACGGRTAHKAARHGLKLNGKLARIEEHEEKLLKNIKGMGKIDFSAPGKCEIDSVNISISNIIESKRKKKNVKGLKVVEIEPEYLNDECVKEIRKLKRKNSLDNANLCDQQSVVSNSEQSGKSQRKKKRKIV